MEECEIFDGNKITGYKNEIAIEGKWIWSTEATKPGSWIDLRKTFKLTKRPSKAIAKIAVDSKYWLWINGELTVFEGQVKGSPSPHGIYFDELDLTPLLRIGDNTIAVLAVYFGKDGYGFFDSGTPGMLFNLNVDGKCVLISDRTWKSIPDPAYHDAIPQKDKSYRLAEPDINYHAEDALENWQDVDFNDEYWPNVNEYERPFEELWQRPIPYLDVREIEVFTKNGQDNTKQWKKQICDDSKYYKYVIKNKTNIQGTPYLKVVASAGERIEMYADTWKETADNGDSIRHIYFTKDGEQEFEALGWINGYEIFFEIPSTIKVLELGFRPSVYRIDKPSEFSCDDEFINAVVKKSYDTLLVTMRDTFMDCPDRERAQWIGDAVNEMQMGFYGMDENAGYLFKKAINQALHFTHKSGVLPSTVPNGLERGEILDDEGDLTEDAIEKKLTQCFELPMQSLAFVHSFWNYYMYSGDRQPLQAGYKVIMKYLRLWKFDETTGTVNHRSGTWDWDDWGYNFDVKIFDQLWYYIAATSTYKISSVLGEVSEDDKHFLEHRIEGIQEHFENNYWNEEYGGYYDHTDNGLLDDRIAALTIYSGLAKTEHHDDLVRTLTTRFESSPYMEKYVMEALYLLNEDNEAIKRIKTRYEDMVDDYFPTLWEFWIAADGTRNHAWTGAPLTMAYAYNVGILPLLPGYESIEIRPHLGTLTKVLGCINSPNGQIKVEILAPKIGPKKMDINLSKKTKLIRINVPILFISDVLVINGYKILVKDDIQNLPKGINFIARNKHYVTFDIVDVTKVDIRVP